MSKGLFFSQAKPETQVRYVLDGKRLAVRWLGEDQAGDFIQLGALFVAKAKAGMYATSTLRLYREQVLAYCKSLGATPRELAFIRNFDVSAVGVGGMHTSAKKLQRVSETDSRLLLDSMRSHGATVMSEEAACFFESGLLFGLRPVEWCCAELAVFDPAWKGDVMADFTPTHRLVVRNAKVNAVRGNSDVRNIYAQLSVEQVKAVSLALSLAHQNAGDWGRYYKRLCNALRYAAKSLWPRRSRLPSFYTARHQCIANGKASGDSPADLAAIFGHASDQTAKRHYSRRINGDKKLHMIAASRLSLEAVRNQSLTDSLRKMDRLGRDANGMNTPKLE